MIDHRDAIELAATAIDFVLDDPDRERLDEHLRTCKSCRIESSALARDAAALASLPDLEPPTWVRRAIGRPHGPRRAVLLIAAAAVLAATVGVAIAVGANLRDQSTPNLGPSPAPTSIVVPGTPRPSVGASPSASPSLPVPAGPPPVGKPASFPAGAGSARMAPGPDGGFWVLAEHPADIDPKAESTTVIGLLDRNGKPRPGWPVALAGWTCDSDSAPHGLPVAADGSIRLVCAADTATEGPQRHVALAFGADGQPLPGWPVELPAGVGLASVVGDELRVLASEIASTDGSTSQAQAAAWWVIGVSATGGVRVGQRYEVADAAGNFDVRLAADGVAYRVAFSGGPDTGKTELTAIDLDGQRPGWPVTVDGIASQPVVGPDGRLVITRRVGQGPGVRAQTMTIDPSGGEATATSDGLPIDPLDDRTGAGAEVLSPVVAAGGATFVIGVDVKGQRVFVIDPPLAGRGVPPALLKMPLQPMGQCSGADVGCGVWRTPPVVGPDGTLYVPESAVGEGGGLVSSSGGSLVAIAPDGTVRAGWPVFLPDTMAGFWSVLPRADGTVAALEMVPTDGGGEWTLVVLGANGAIRSSTPIIRS